jgi:predicted  nucleic acid-binding Zn-ribbon protein
MKTEMKEFRFLIEFKTGTCDVWTQKGKSEEEALKKLKNKIEALNKSPYHRNFEYTSIEKF